MLNIHKEIHGRWFRYWLTKRSLSQEQQKNVNRIGFYDFERRDDAYISGFITSESEWQLEKPNYEKDEHICWVAVNSKGQFLRLTLFRSRQADKKVNIILQLHLKLNENDVYLVKEQYSLPITEFNPNEYKAGPLSIEILNPFRKLRLKFRGYLKNEQTNEVVFAKLRLHWYSLSNVFDHKASYNSAFIAQQLVKNDSKCTEVEDRLEQFGNIKGTFEIEKEGERQLFLWGLRSKNIYEKGQRSVRLIGVAKNGYAFDIGLVSNPMTGVRYSYGVTKDANGVIEAVSYSNMHVNEIESISSNQFEFTLKTSKNSIVVKVEKKSSHLRNASINDVQSKCFYISDDFNDEVEQETKNKLAYKVYDSPKCSSDMVLPLTDPSGQSVAASGGKGASLASLTQLSELTKEQFRVPKGLIITSAAYSLLIEENSKILEQVKKLETVCWNKLGDLQSICRETQELISNEKIPEKIKLEIEKNLINLYGDSIRNVQFAVRSSAVGEDSEEMSGAGQLTTYLGVKGIDEITKAVMKCWASQFSFNYTEYKRGYGQLINDSMAVVVLEMVNCDTAGVIFTCDPLNGDERTIVITANYGLGESVVSASSEPDTIRVKVGITSNDLNVSRTVEEIERIDIGKKAKYITMNTNEGGTVELDVEKTNECCVEKEHLLKLAEVALVIHAYYGNARDIEWGIKDGQIYILQSRPVTNLDSFNEWELMHDFDAGFQQEKLFVSRAHWNENFPGSSSPLCVSFIFKILDYNFQALILKMQGEKMNRLYYCPYLYRTLPTFYTQLFFNFAAFFSTMKKSRNENFAFMGQDLHDDDMDVEMQQTKQFKPGFFFRLSMLGNLIFGILFSGYFVRRIEHKTKSRNWFPKMRSQTPFQLFSEMVHEAWPAFESIAIVHTMVSMGTGFFTTIMLNILTSSTDNENDALHDFGLIQAGNTGILSAEVPKLLREIANAIENKKMFLEMSDNEALNYLLFGSDSASQLFQNFLKKHGYRGIRELDPYVLQWNDEPIKLIPLLKSSTQRTTESQKQTPTLDELLSSLRSRPSFIKRLLLRFIIPLSFRATRLRERTKSMLSYYVSRYRIAFYCLADKLVAEEGKLPEKDLLFFLSLAEIEQLIKERNPMLVVKAKQRKRVRTKTDKFLFPLITKDWEINPLNTEKKIDVSALKGALTVQGTAVTPLVTRGRVYVAPSIEDAKDIQNEDILITHTTDIGWSPYFPLVSGVVTEMGGLNSHGAVIAREFGLPCLVGATDACHLFKTGDVVIIDGQKGTITLVDE